MERVAIVVRLKDGSGPRAAELIAGGPPFDLAETGIARHSVYLSSGELIDSPFQPKLQSALDQWRAIVDGSPRIARERFGWDHDEAETEAGTEALAASDR